MNETIRNLLDLLFDPNLFFEEQADESKNKEAKMFGKSIVFYLVLNLIFFVIGLLSFAVLYGNEVMPVFSITYVGSLVLYILLSFYFHIFVWIMGGRKGVLRTLQVNMYCAAPSVALGLVPYLNYAGMLYSIILTVIGISKMHELSVWKSILAYALQMIVAMAIAMAVFLLFPTAMNYI
jgi:hypothetical protein